MKVLYRISTRTTENSNYKLHIPVVATVKPLCRQHEKDKSLASYEYTEGKPTCKKCLRIFYLETGRTYDDYEATESILDKISALPLITEIRL
jgi:hypothetical protein